MVVLTTDCEEGNKKALMGFKVKTENSKVGEHLKMLEIVLKQVLQTVNRGNRMCPYSEKETMK